MTGNQYFILIMLGISAYFAVKMSGLYLKHKEIVARYKEAEARIKISSDQMHEHRKNLEFILNSQKEVICRLRNERG